jgi:hypothetical protein
MPARRDDLPSFRPLAPPSPNNTKLSSLSPAGRAHPKGTSNSRTAERNGWGVAGAPPGGPATTRPRHAPLGCQRRLRRGPERRWGSPGGHRMPNALEWPERRTAPLVTTPQMAATDGRTHEPRRGTLSGSASAGLCPGRAGQPRCHEKSPRQRPRGRERQPRRTKKPAGRRPEGKPDMPNHASTGSAHGPERCK